MMKYLLLVLFLLLPIITTSFAYGDFKSNGEYFCNTKNLEIEKIDYEREINRIDSALKVYKLDHKGASLKELYDYVFRVSDDFNIVNKMAKCLKEEHGIEPDTVTKFSEDTLEVFVGDTYELSQVAPKLVQYSASILCKGAENFYKFSVDDINDFLNQYPTLTLEEIGKYVGTAKNKSFEFMNSSASYLKDNCNQNPDSIAKLDPIIYKALALYDLTPEQIPEFGIVTILALGGAVAFAVAYRFFGAKFFSSSV